MEQSTLNQRVKDQRMSQGFSQEELANKSGLSLRTIQRIENGETVPRGDTLKRLSITLQSTPDTLIDWKVQEDTNLLLILHLSQLTFLAFPILGTIIPLAIWILKKEKIKYVDETGKSILNFQFTWTISLFTFYLLLAASMIFHLPLLPINSFFSIILFVGFLYLYNIIFILRNTILYKSPSKVKYLPAIRFLR